jgi:hypothetical protein
MTFTGLILYASNIPQELPESTRKAREIPAHQNKKKHRSDSL